MMPLPIEDYALIGDCNTAALVGRDGSIDWLCIPCFDSGACFAAMLGGPEHGRWLIAPVARVLNTRRRYREGTLILETDFETDEGAVRIIDCMPLSNERWDVLRIVEGSACTSRSTTARRTSRRNDHSTRSGRSRHPRRRGANGPRAVPTTDLGEKT
jgi:GH15 family glucan-1,4-alpha-glucosidase